MNRFFHLPSLYVYLLAAILLVTSVFHAASIVRYGLYAILGLNTYTDGGFYYDKESVELTPEALEYVNNLQRERQQRSDTANLLRSAILLALSAGFFFLFWRRGLLAAETEMLFSVRNFYFFLVSSIAFLIFFYSLSAGLSTLTDIVIGTDYYFYPSFSVPREPAGTAPKTTLTLEDVKTMIAEQEARQMEGMGRNRQRRLVDRLTVSVVALPIFLWHNKQLTPAKP